MFSAARVSERFLKSNNNCSLTVAALIVACYAIRQSGRSESQGGPR